jgi:uncharacterized protein (DUF2344 family)
VDVENSPNHEEMQENVEMTIDTNNLTFNEALANEIKRNNRELMILRKESKKSKKVEAKLTKKTFQIKVSEGAISETGDWSKEIIESYYLAIASQELSF